MKKPAANKKEDNANNAGATRQMSDLEAKISTFEQKIEGLQKSLRDKESAIAELKDKTVKQEKKINDTTRAKSALEKDATVKEIKERILQQQQQQQKKDDQTRARLALPDSPIAKAVLDETIKENKDLHLRIQAMVMQAQEEKKTVAEISQMVDNYKRELALAESKNQALEQELQAAKAETLRIQRQIAHLRDPLPPGHFTSHTTSTTDIPIPTSDSSTKTDSSKAKTKPSPVKTESSHEASSASTTKDASTPTPTPTSPSESTQPKSQPTTPRAPYTVPPLKPTSQMNIQTHTPPTQSTAPTSPTSTTTVSPHTNGIPNKEADASVNSTTSPRDTLAELETYDLSSLAKELDAKSLPSSPSSLSLARDLGASSLAAASSNSLSDLMDSLDNTGSPMQALDFISLAQDKNVSAPAQPSLMSPTARVEMRAPFSASKGENEYDKDFISMFSPPGNTNLKRVRTNPTLNNLFYTDDTASPPSFNLEGIDKDFLSNNPDSELSSPRSQPQSPSHFEPAQQAKRGSPSPTANFALHRSSSVSPPPPSNSHEDYPTIRPKGAHKSIFSVFGNENATDATSPPPGTTPPPSTTPSSQGTTQPPAPLPPAPHAGHDELLLSFGSKVDTNKAGLRRAKKVNFAAFAKGKVKVEPTMEDVHFCIYPYMKSKSRALFAVFDGHAGRAAADEAAALFPKEFNTQLEASSQDVPNAFLKTYAAVDEAMKEYEYMGTTATVVYLWQKEGHKYLQASNVGDSTSFLCRNGVTVKLTVDHKPSAQEEKERMRLAGIEVSDNQTRINGLAVSRSLGNHFVKEQNIGMIAVPYVGERIEILPTDTHLIVASDGLWDVVTPQHAFDIIKGMEALPAASQLLSTALAHNKCNDNVSIIVVRLN